MTVIDRFVQAVSHGGAMKPTLTVIHSAETPLKAGYAKSIAENWFGKSATTSAHFMCDPVEIVRMLSDNVVAYAVGPKANGFTLNWEQAGYARFSRAEWTTPDGLAQMDRLAAGVRERNDANGIPNRWASDDDIRNAAKGIPGGICFHDDIRRVLGGTTHNDPMPYYPRDLLMPRILANPAGTTNVQAPARLLPLITEDPMQLPPNQTVHLTVPSVPKGYKAELTVTGQSDVGSVVYAKGIAPGGGVARLLGTAADWKLWLAPGFRGVADVSSYAAVELINYGADNKKDALAGATIVLVPAA